MTNKDHSAIARILAGDYACSTPEGKRAIWRVTLSLADLFVRDDPDFSRRSFYRAVFGVEDHFAALDSTLTSDDFFYDGRNLVSR